MSLFERFESYYTYAPDSDDHGGLEGVSFSEGLRDLPTGEKIHWIQSDQKSQNVLFFVHGNSGNITSYGNYYKLFESLGLSFVAFDYPGYGKSSGYPTETSLYAGALSMYEQLLEIGFTPDRIYCYGLSLGGAVSVELAQHKKIGKLILESTFTCSRDMGRLTPAARLGLHYLVPNRFQTIEKIGSINCPLLIIHGNADERVPLEHAHRIFQGASEPKSLAIIPEAQHHNVVAVGGEKIKEIVSAFLKN